MSTPCLAVELVTFDVGTTLLTLRPNLPALWAARLAESGHSIDVDKLARAIEQERPEAARRRVASVGPGHQVSVDVGEHRRTTFVENVLRRAGLPEPELDAGVRLIRDALNGPAMYQLYDDTLPALQGLWERGLKLGVISNTWPSMPRILMAFGLDAYLGFWVISEFLGVEKPHQRIFERALEIAAVEPGRAVHVGDDPESDAAGARAVGMNAVLLDRGGTAARVVGIPTIRRLDELLDLLA